MVATDTLRFHEEADVSPLVDRLRAALSPRYDVEEEVGSGGQAVVFRGFDHALERRVAIKVLRPQLATAIGAERFTREAKALAAVAHPYLVSVHDAGSAEGLLYYTMDFIAAPTLRRKLEAKPLTTSAAVRLVDGILEALTAVHEAGFVHRDVKPENVFVQGDHPILTDFGIAKVIRTTTDEPLTELGNQPGTRAYMAPEQLLGRQVEPATDLYAVGLILYECLADQVWPAGRRPEEEDVDWEPVPRTLRPVIACSLQHSPEDRFPDAAAFRAALADAFDARASPRRTGSRAALIAGLTLALAGGAAWAIILMFGPTGDPPQRVAIGRCLDTSPAGDQPHVAVGVGEAVSRALRGLPGLTVKDYSSVPQLAATTDAREIGSALQVDAVVRCAVRRAGERVEGMVLVEDVRSGARTHERAFDVAVTEFLRLGDRIAEDLAPAFGQPAPRARQRPGLDPRVFDAYARGRLAWADRTEDATGGALRDAERQFRLALSYAPRFTLALAGLADVYVALPGRGLATPSEAFATARALADSAIAIDPRVAAPYAARAEAIRAHFWEDWADAEPSFRAALARDSAQALARLWYAQLLVAEGRHEQAVEQAERAYEYGPRSADLNTGLGLILYLVGRPERAVQQLEPTVSRWPASWEARLWLAAALIASERPADALVQLMAVRDRTPPAALPALTAALAAAGDSAQARALFSVGREGSPFWTALSYEMLGDRSRALEWLEAAYLARDEFLTLVGAVPLLEALRADPAFEDLRARLPWMRGP